jgi:hypothetical protein
MDKKENNRELRVLIFGEAAVAVLTVAGAFLVSLFSEYVFGFSAVTGALLGALIVVLNFAFLSLSVNRAVDEYLAVRGSREMTDEEAEKFTAENSMVIQNKIKTSYIIRTTTMLAALVVAFLTGWFNPLCTVIPFLAFKPILSIGEMLRKKYDPAPNPDNFVKYEENDEKESDE